MAPFRHSFGSSTATATGDAAFIASFAVSVASASMGETAQKADVLMNGEDDAISMIESTLLRCSSLFTLDILESLSDELMHSLLASLLSVEQQRKQRPSSRASRASSRILALLVHRDGILAVVFSLLIIPGCVNAFAPAIKAMRRTTIASGIDPAVAVGSNFIIDVCIHIYHSNSKNRPAMTMMCEIRVWLACGLIAGGEHEMGVISSTDVMDENSNHPRDVTLPDQSQRSAEHDTIKIIQAN